MPEERCSQAVTDERPVGPREAKIRLAAAAIANARDMRHGVPTIVNVLDVLPDPLRDELLEDARVALIAVGCV